MHSVREELSITNWGFAQISLMACQSNNKVWHTNQSSLVVVSVPLCTIAVRLNFHGPTQQTFNYGHATQNGANNFLKEFCKMFIPPRQSSLSWIWWCRPSFYPSLGSHRPTVWWSKWVAGLDFEYSKHLVPICVKS